MTACAHYTKQEKQWILISIINNMDKSSPNNRSLQIITSGLEHPQCFCPDFVRPPHEMIADMRVQTLDLQLAYSAPDDPTLH